MLQSSRRRGGDEDNHFGCIEPGRDYLSFVSIELLWKVIAPRRWEILKAMAAKGPVSLRSVSRAVGRDVKTTHGDVHALLNAGILKKTDDGKIVFPYDAIHVDFMIHGVAA
jgi:predicted transcriptional regulator